MKRRYRICEKLGSEDPASFVREMGRDHRYSWSGSDGHRGIGVLWIKIGANMTTGEPESIMGFWAEPPVGFCQFGGRPPAV